MRRFITITLLALAMSGTSSLFAQQEAMYTQYVYNKQFYNPAYTGFRETMNFSAQHRSQWVGFKGAPMTQLISMDTPLQLDELAVGGSVMHDKIGPSSELQLSADVAYRIRFTNRTTLSFGAKVTAGLYQSNLQDVDLISDFFETQDEYFMFNQKGVFLPNVGFGTFYHGKNFYVGLSAPKMLRNRLVEKGSDLYNMLYGRTEPTVYLHGGKTFKLNRYVKLQPNMLIKGTINAPISASVFMSMIYMDQLQAGVFYNFNEIAGGVIQWQMDKNWRLGYSMDLATSSLIRTNYGSHEIMVNYTMTNKRKRIIYPRYF